ncbi:aminotransferase class III-fold pyridoxal phosphate-dependent enzyme [Microbacterium betulae]|uniref:Aminotransferase class III-fold pyridoxal phosphate-dependent enzyme n=1 Tax=Microbacterium betulae TaxID=2981139 RepID=A0AA97I564_9MICO|nr:aminotransferase class III-fold pyridoxal phosphate-dependent enzyme [Microbacterium sp. AB]WOF23371.1 aminotransferase class III-fold pyridoxal phosphate-dependent enzyme [Microbacterium sp. AB]
MNDAARTGPALWSAQAHMPSVLGRQIVVTRGEGNYVHTTDGRRLFDGTAGLWHANIGHGRAEMAEAAAEQMARLETYHVFGRYLNDRAVELAERVRDLSPVADSKVILNSGGSDAVDVALKLARRYWQLLGRTEKTVILSRDLSYHGLHAYGTSVAGIDVNREGYGTESLVADTARFDTRDIEKVRRTVAGIGPERIAAIVAEPIQGTGGVIPPEPGYLEGLQRIADENDILLVLDEVITGFGRTGHWFATERYGLRPHIIAMAKGISSGYSAVGGAVVAPEVWEPFYESGGPVYRHGTTYSGHATSAAVALKNLEIIEREGLIGRVRELEGVLSAELGSISSDPRIAETRVAGFLGGIELRPEYPAERVADEMLEQGWIARPLRGNVVQVSPPFTTTDDEVRGIVAAAVSALDVVAPVDLAMAR